MCKSVMVMCADGGVLIRYICCDECGIREVFENAGLGEVYDESVVESSKFKCRLCLIESKIKKVETLVEQVSTELTRIRKQFREHVESALTLSSSSFEKVEELRSSILAIEQRFVSVDNEWPVAGRDKSVSERSEIQSSSGSA